MRELWFEPSRSDRSHQSVLCDRVVREDGAAHDLANVSSADAVSKIDGYGVGVDSVGDRNRLQQLGGQDLPGGRWCGVTDFDD